MATRTEERSRFADKPGKLPKSAWFGVLRRTFAEFSADNMTDWAAALTYYGILSIFPALVALVSILGLVGRSATEPLLENLSGFAPGPAHQILANAIRGLAHTRSGAGIVFVVGLVGLALAIMYTFLLSRESRGYHDQTVVRRGGSGGGPGGHPPAY